MSWTWENVNNTLRLNDLSTFASRNFPRLTKRITGNATSPSPNTTSQNSSTSNLNVSHQNSGTNMMIACLAGIGACTLAISTASLILYYYRNYKSNIMRYPTDYKGFGIVITGCDSGIGRATAVKMSRSYKDILIFAGCLTDEGIEELQCNKLSNEIR